MGLWLCLGEGWGVGKPDRFSPLKLKYIYLSNG